MNILSVRKRAAASDDASAGSASQPPVKETASPVKDVFFIHEEPCNDIGIVQIIDGPICGIHFKSYIDEKKKSGDGSEDIKKLRLIRKDELVVVQGDHMLPISCSAVCGPHDNPEATKAELINYGDDNVLLLRDCNGALISLIRNATEVVF
uniref:Uncharacterized protein n=1 Tax=Panagrolaimus davidi TaxID=227884 RepID=A0A914PWW6_9BILA